MVDWLYIDHQIKKITPGSLQIRGLFKKIDLLSNLIHYGRFCEALTPSLIHEQGHKSMLVSYFFLTQIAEHKKNHDGTDQRPICFQSGGPDASEKPRQDKSLCISQIDMLLSSCLVLVFGHLRNIPQKMLGIFG